MIATILTTLGPVVSWLIRTFIKDRERAEEILKSYYGHIEQSHMAGKHKVDMHMALNEARKAKQLELLKAKKLRDEEKNNEQ